MKCHWMSPKLCFWTWLAFISHPTSVVFFLVNPLCSLEGYELINDKQVLFRLHWSTDDFFCFIKYNWHETRDRHRGSQIIALHISKEFEKVSHSALMNTQDFVKFNPFKAQACSLPEKHEPQWALLESAFKTMAYKHQTYSFHNWEKNGVPVSSW